MEERRIYWLVLITRNPIDDFARWPDAYYRNLIIRR